MKKTIFIWILGGFFLVAGAFFIPEQAGSLWPSVISGSLAAFLYLTVFTYVWLKKINVTRKRKAIGWTVSVLLLFSMVSAGLSYEASNRQTELLPSIRTTIDSNMALLAIKKPLLKTLRSYRLENPEKREGQTLGDIFKTRFDSLITEDQKFRYGYTGTDDGMLDIYVAELKPDSVVLVAESGYIKGYNANFQNFSGQTGLFQTRGVLTEEGVLYERTN